MNPAPPVSHPATISEATPPSHPIADVSYRHYDGVLHTRVARWWIVAVASLRLVVKKRGFWVVAAISVLPSYVLFGFLLYFQSRFPMGRGNPLLDNTSGQKFASVFFQAYQSQLFWLFILSFWIGPGSIAADNQTNALVVYLSKPLTKGDYLLGKWMGIFLILFAIAVFPAVVLYAYCLLSYLDDGFLRDERWLFFRMLGATMIPGIIHASVHVGCSAWSKSPRMAGAVYAGLFLITGFIASAYWAIRYHGQMQDGIDIRHFSIGGVIQGLAQNVFGVTVHMARFSRRQGMANLTLEPPSLRLMLALAVALVVVGVVAARMRIRAVEVVRG